MKTIKKFLLSITIPLLISSFNANADIKTGNSQATASINPACRVKVDNLNFGDVSIQSTSGNGDVFATTELSLLCTKDQSATFTSNLGVNATGTSSTWINGSNFICQVSVGGEWVTAGGAQGGFAGRCTQYNSVFGSTSIFGISTTPYRAEDMLFYRSIRPDGSSITLGESPSYGLSNLVSGGNRIPYSISTNNSTYAPINATASNQLIYNQNNGDWQAFNLYGKANVKQAAPGVYTDTNTITVNF